MLKEQEHRLDTLVAGLMKSLGKGTASLVQSYKDIEENCGRDMKKMLEKEPENFPLP